MTRSYKFLTVKEQRHMASLYKAGWSVPQIARIYERAGSTVWEALTRQGVRMRKPSIPGRGREVSEQEVTLVHGLYERGMSLRHIAELVGKNPEWVRRRLIVAGIPRRTTSDSLRIAHRVGRR